MQWCFNEHKDVPRDIRDFVDNASGGQFNNLSIEEINDFLTTESPTQRCIQSSDLDRLAAEVVPAVAA